VKKTKIVATFGPSVASLAMIRRLVGAGVNIFRINCSHGRKADFAAAASLIRRGVRGATFPVGLLFDISGPKLRLDRFEGEYPIKAGREITITVGRSDLKKGIIAVNHPGIIKSVRKGERLFIDDGALAFEIRACDKNSARLVAMNPGTILPGKGVNLPDTDIKIPTITDKDREDIQTAVEVGADYVALSFVRAGDDIIEARRIIRGLGGRQKVIAKLEKREAIENLDNIMLLSDGVMVARGDLGVELPPQELPNLQKRIIKLANLHRKAVIVATQMLESMRFSPRATRAEINDVASAVFDYVDAVMLSAETATGEYPLEAVKTMASVIDATEANCGQSPGAEETFLVRSEIPNAIAEAVSRSDERCTTSVIFAFTSSGFTAEMISNLRSSRVIVALTADRQVMTRLTLSRGVYPVQIRQLKSVENMLDAVDRIGHKFKLVKDGDTVIVTGGIPFGFTVPTNFMMYHKIGKKPKP
jgi:pyruvate kinase